MSSAGPRVRIAIISHCPKVTEAACQALADYEGCIETFSSERVFRRHVASTHLDLVIVDDSSRDQLQPRIADTFAREMKTRVLFLNVASEESCDVLLRLGAEEAVVVDSPTLAVRLARAARRAANAAEPEPVQIGDL